MSIHATGHGLLAERVMKARSGGTCRLCRGAITIGQRIGLVPATGWAHVPCIIAAARQAPMTR